MYIDKQQVNPLPDKDQPLSRQNFVTKKKKKIEKMTVKVFILNQDEYKHHSWHLDLYSLKTDLQNMHSHI